MPQGAEKRRKQPTPSMQHFIFEIKEWKPSYLFSIDHSRYRDGPFSEHVGIELEASCIFPEDLVARNVMFHVAGKRDCLEPEILRHDPDWKPRCVGLLELPPERGTFLTSVPHESLAVLLIALAHGLLRFILLYGPPLSRRKSLCSSIEWASSVNLEDY